MIPKITTNILSHSRNILSSVFTDRSYYDYVNLFRITKIKIGPFRDKHYLNCKVVNFKNHTKFNSEDKFEKLNYKYSIKEEIKKGETMSYSIFEFNDDFLIDSDIKLIISGRKINFYSWINFFYSTLDIFIHIIGHYMKDTEISSQPVKNVNKAVRESRMNLNADVIELGDVTHLMKKKKDMDNGVFESSAKQADNKNEKINELFSNRKLKFYFR
jgi:hypothetical protein